MIICAIAALFVISHKLDLMGKLTKMSGPAVVTAGTTSETQQLSTQAVVQEQNPKVKVITFHIRPQLDVSGEHTRPQTQTSETQKN